MFALDPIRLTTTAFWNSDLASWGEKCRLQSSYRRKRRAENEDNYIIKLLFQFSFTSLYIHIIENLRNIISFEYCHDVYGAWRIIVMNTTIFFVYCL